MAEKESFLRSNLCVVLIGAVFVTLILFIAWLPSTNPSSEFLNWSSFGRNPKCPLSHEHEMPPLSEKLKTWPVISMILSIILGIAFVASLVCLIIWMPVGAPYSVFFPSLNVSEQVHPCPENNLDDQKNETLESILTRVSTNKTLIIAVVNKAYVENEIYNGSTTMLNNFLESFWLGENTRELLDNLLLVAADRTAYEWCHFSRLNCYKMETDGVDFEGEKIFMSDDFIRMMWRRTELLLNVLKMGFNFIFTDTDVLWLRNPFKNLSNETRIDLQISVDKHKESKSEEHSINTGFYFVRSNNRTIALFDKWHSMKDNSTGKKEQDVLEDLIKENIFTKLNITAKYLDPLYFNGFCSTRRDIRVVTTVHANCCRSIRAKVSDLTAVLHDWQVFKRNPVNGTGTSLEGTVGNRTMWYDWSKPANCQNSWK